jgi:uncharacterized protein YutE (UPF0331/DUF86 family)
MRLRVASLAPVMVDRTLVAAKIAAVRDAAGRVRAVLPQDREVFLADRTSREVVLLNLFVALQECLSLATHWLADEGLDVPPTYGDVFRRLGEREVIAQPLASRLAAASGFRNLVAHRYGTLDWSRVHQIALDSLDDCSRSVIAWPNVPNERNKIASILLAKRRAR